MFCKKCGSNWSISGRRYRIELFEGANSARLSVKGTCQHYWFYPSGSVTGGDGSNDETLSASAWEYRRDGEKIIFSREEKSSLWEKRIATWIFSAGAIELFFTVSGKGRIGEVRYCRGCFAGAEYGFAGEFDEIFNPAPNFHDCRFYHPTARFSISAGSDISPAVGGQALVSCVPCIGLHDRRDEKYVAVGVAARAGENSFDDFIWNPPPLIPSTGYIGDQLRAGGFAISYAGKKQFDGHWETPRLIMTFARTEKDVLPKFMKHCFAEKYFPRPRRKKIYSWWREPIYCTWHDQQALNWRDSMDFSGPGAGTFCTEKNVEEFLGELLDHDCRPGIIILDDKWQINLNDGDPDPERFPDMRRWIEKCHERNIKVFLWTLAWNNDNIPLEQAITRDGKIVCGDITDPAYAARFREMLRRYFSSEKDCLNADGIKLDGSLNLPTGSGLKNHADIWGYELQKYYLDMLFSVTKSIKKEACVSTFAAHPYFADSSDMVRLADMYSSRISPHESMLFRAEIYRQTMPYSLIDTDGQMAFSLLPDSSKELARQAEIGIPTLYNGKYIRRWHFYQPAVFETFSGGDYRNISRALKKYRKENGLK